MTGLALTFSSLPAHAAEATEPAQQSTSPSLQFYGRAYPEAAAYPQGINPQAIIPLTPYSIPAGQRYVAEGPFPSDYYYSPTYAPQVEGSNHRVVVGQTLYYQVSYNHRFAFVKASAVDVIPADGPGNSAAEN